MAGGDAITSQNKILGGMKGLHAGLSGLAAYLSSTLIKERLIPEQLGVIGTVGTFFILVALLLTLAYWSKLHKALTPFVIVTCIALLALTFMQLNYVVAANVGQPDEKGVAPEHHFLIGYELTDYGNKRGELLGQNKSEKEYIETGGYDLIPLWYGNSYKVMAVLYTSAYMLFVVGVVVVGGALLRRGGDAAVEAWAASSGARDTNGRRSVDSAPDGNSASHGSSTPPVPQPVDQADRRGQENAPAIEDAHQPSGADASA